MSLLENIVAKRNKINFDLTKSLNENIYNIHDVNPDLNLPIETQESSWETININNIIFMRKHYSFKRNQHLIYFVTEILELANRTLHHPIVLIDENIVQIKLYTKDINDITEIDIAHSKHIDELYEEINYIMEF